MIRFVIVKIIMLMHRWRTSRSKSFLNAFRGIGFNLRHEPNFLLQLTVALLVVTGGFIFSLGRTEWIMVILSIGSVIAAEAMNTAVEKICDRFMDSHDPMVRRIKDSAAAAVLLISVSAAIIGILIFWPHIKELLT